MHSESASFMSMKLNSATFRLCLTHSFVSRA